MIIPLSLMELTPYGLGPGGGGALAMLLLAPTVVNTPNGLTLTDLATRGMVGRLYLWMAVRLTPAILVHLYHFIRLGCYLCR